MKIVVSHKADGDLLRTFVYLANLAAAESFIADINRKFEQLARFPFISRERSALQPGLRSVLVGTHLVFYLMREQEIAIVCVIDGCMDIDEEFQR